MLRIARQYPFGDPARLFAQRQGRVPARQDREQRQRVERLRFVVLRKLRRQRRHLIGIGAVARGLVAGPVERVDRREIPLLARGSGLRCALLRRGSQLRQCRAARGHVLMKPDRLIEGHRLAPVSERKRRIDLLRRAKGLDRVFIAEAVEPRDSAQEVSLRRRGAGVGQDDGAEWRADLRRGGDEERQRHGERQRQARHRILRRVKNRRHRRAAV